MEPGSEIGSNAGTAASAAAPASDLDPLQQAQHGSFFGQAGAQFAAQLYRAMHGGVWGLWHNFSQIVRTLYEIPDELRAQVKDLYFEHYDLDLEADLKGELFGLQQSIAVDLLHGNKVSASAGALHLAMRGPGTKENLVFFVLEQLSEQELHGVSLLYESRYGRTLHARLCSDFSGWQLDLAQALLAKDDTAVFVARIHGAFDRRFPDTANILQALALLSVEERNKIAAGYQSKHAESLLQLGQRRLPTEVHEVLAALLDGRQPEAERIVLRKEIVSRKADVEKIVQLFEGRTAEQRQDLLKAYKDAHGSEMLSDLAGAISYVEMAMLKRMVKHGSLSDARRIKYLLDSETHTCKAVCDILEVYDRAGMETLRSEFASLCKRSLDSALDDKFSGRNALRLKLMLQGKPGDLREELRRLNLERDFERIGLGRYVFEAISNKGRRFERALRKANSYGTIINESGLHADPQEQGCFERSIQFARSDLDLYRGAKDSLIDRTSSISGSLAATGALTAGLSLPLSIAAAGVAGAVSYLGMKAALRGKTYDTTRVGIDLAIGVLDGIVTAAALHSGQLITKAAGGLGKISAQEMIRGTSNELASELAKESLEAATRRGFSTSFQGALIGAFVSLFKSSTWQYGFIPGVQKIALSFVTDGCIGTAGRMSALAVRRRARGLPI